MIYECSVRTWVRSLLLMFLAASVPAQAQAPASQGSATDANVVTATGPMEVETEGPGVHGQLIVAPELLSPDTRADLVFTITREPRHGRVGLAGDADDGDFFRNKTSRLAYYAYRADDDYEGEDSFAYSVRNETTGLVFQNMVRLVVRPAPPVTLDTFEVTSQRERNLAIREVAMTTRPNSPVTRKLPSHEDFMAPQDRAVIEGAKVAYFLDDKARPKNGSAKLDRATGELTYAPNPGFIGEDRFRYYTVDESNPHLGAENTIVVSVEPIRYAKRVTADRSRSREVDLVFVINNSPSMAAHQDRIAANLSRFRELFHTRDLEYRMGVLTTDFVPAGQRFYKEVRGTELDASGRPVLDRRGQPRSVRKRVASNGGLVTLPALPQPWVTPQTPDAVFAELVKVGTNGNSNRTAFTAVYNFVADYYNKRHALLRPEATTIVVFFMDEEETRMATWREGRNGSRTAEWVENGTLPELLKKHNERNPEARQTLDGYINYWVLRPFIIAKGNKRGKIEMHAVVSPQNVSHRRAAELTGGTVLNIEQDFSRELAALGDRIADTVAVALDPVGDGRTFYRKSLRVVVDGREVAADPVNGYVYDELTHSIRFQGEAKKLAFTGKIEITYEEHM